MVVFYKKLDALFAPAFCSGFFKTTLMAIFASFGVTPRLGASFAVTSLPTVDITSTDGYFMMAHPIMLYISHGYVRGP